MDELLPVDEENQKFYEFREELMLWFEYLGSK
jgi:hypothetical protein